jgi:2-dehydro-3-deoxygalactonokinase
MAALSTFTNAALIAIDWGTSRLRARLLDAGGRVLGEAESDEGIGRIEGGHEAIFERLAGDWPVVPAIMAGMVGSRQGWREAPYVPCPASVPAIAAAVARFETARGRAMAIVPGLAFNIASRDGDVMRGEETQIAGLIDGEPAFAGVAILPGTHSKWVRVDRGTIVDFQTFITGELFELLAQTSFLRHSVAGGGGDLSAMADFALGAERTARDGLPFLNALFSVRARQLLSDVNRVDNLAYLSGILVGGEIAAARMVQPLPAGTPIRIVGSTSLARAYGKALQILGWQTTTLDGDRMAHDGLVHLAREIGLLPMRAA